MLWFVIITIYNDMSMQIFQQYNIHKKIFKIN